MVLPPLFSFLFQPTRRNFKSATVLASSQRKFLNGRYEALYATSAATSANVPMHLSSPPIPIVAREDAPFMNGRLSTPRGILTRRAKRVNSPHRIDTDANVGVIAPSNLGEKRVSLARAATRRAIDINIC